MSNTTNIFANFSKNFYSRVFFRYLSLIFITLTIYFLFQIEAIELAVFFLIRSALRLFSALAAPLSGAEIFFKKFINKNDFDSAFMQHFILSSFFILIIGLILTCLLYLFQFILDYLSLNIVELSLIFIWFLSITIGNIFPHYFQIMNKDILSGFSNGVFAQFVIILSLSFIYFFSKITFFNLLLIFSLSYLLNTTIFSIYILATHIQKSSFRHVNFDYFYDKKLYIEMTIGLFSRSNSVLLWISAFFLETQAILILGICFYILPILQIIKGAFRFSVREEWIGSFLDASKFKTTYLKVKNNLLIMNSLILFLLCVSKLVLNNDFYILDNFKYFYEVNYALNLLLIFYLGILVTDHLFVALSNIMVLHGSAVKYLEIKAIALLISLSLLISFNLFIPNLISFIAIFFLINLIANYLSYNYFINIKLLNYGK